MAWGRDLRDAEVWTQLAPRIPKELHLRLKVHCVTVEVSVMDFTVQALEEQLRREAPRARRRAQG